MTLTNATSSVVTRFAPSPTGFLHIGGARTALFNWLYARRHHGRFILRIEDTDQKRSTTEAIDAILEGLEWLGLDWDGEAHFQRQRGDHHAEMAKRLLEEGKAYRCYCPPEELQAMREQAQAEGRGFRYDGRWRDRDPADAPEDVDPVIRLKAPQDGDTIIEDAVQGTVRFPNSEMDDMVLLRSDGTPTYMLAVVVDDHDTGISHIIRGDDHLTNAGRQALIYQAFGWDIPTFAHIPLIHGPDGAKLSKRHGALGIDAYREMGYLPEALRNYLLRLGWSHGDDEIISTDQAIAWFDLSGVGASPSRLDLNKMDHLNAHYLRHAEPDRLMPLLFPLLEERLKQEPTDEMLRRVRAGLPSLVQRATRLNDLADAVLFFCQDRPISLNDKAAKVMADPAVPARLQALHDLLRVVDPWNHEVLDAAIARFVEESGLKFKEVGQPLRAALIGTLQSPGVGEVMAILGKEESLARISDVATSKAA